MSSDLDLKLRRALCEHPRTHKYRYTTEAKNTFLQILFCSLTNDRPEYLERLFPNGFPPSYRLQDVQGAQKNAEYTEAARGRPCGHIFKQGEANYHCVTCTNDPVAVLCARCFASSDHEGHQFHISTSQGNSGCCDCGDEEAWKRPVRCAIHTPTDDFMSTEVDVSHLPQDLQDSITTTISRVLDYFCDIVSCSPENLRTPKTVDSVQQDEVNSRLNNHYYPMGDEIESNPEFCLVLWNDEKHTVREVRDQVARACSEREAFGKAMAEKANNDGRCIVRHSRDLKTLLRMAKIIEEIKITVTIRSSRDTFREQMCETIIDWLSDIAGCQIGDDAFIVRRTICEEMLHLWQVGSRAWYAKVGRSEIDDHELEDNREFRRETLRLFSDPTQLIIERAVLAAENEEDEDPEDDDDDDGDDFDLDGDNLGAGSGDDDFEILDGTPEPHVIVDHAGDPDATDDADEMDTDGDNDFLDATERMDTDQAIPPPPPPPIGGVQAEPAIAVGADTISRGGSETVAEDQNRNYQNIPKTPALHNRTHHSSPNHWTVPPTSRPSSSKNQPLFQDLRKNIRIDSMILFDLRLWKQVRISIRDLLITTVINIPQFKRILGLRFAGVYTTLAQLYLIADREPDHSIINLSLQLLTTPSITEEVVDRGNFLTVLMAILYTFLTTRQVGFPGDVDPDAILGFDAGSVANRRLYHFFSDLRYFLASPFVQSRIRSEKQYLFQYLDMAKLSQGICPNTRAVGEHVEYETDAWISASLLTREINKLCRQFAEAFQLSYTDTGSTESLTCQAIEHTGRATLVNAIGLEHRRFEQSEIKNIVVFHPVGPFPCGQGPFKVVNFAVDQGMLSFHHPLHYTLSWLLEGGKDSISSINALHKAAAEVVEQFHEKNVRVGSCYLPAVYTEAEDALLALFDYPLRVCAWLAQMKANLWVRNGMSLRHQMSQYKSVTYRDVGHHRDLVLMQTALVSCNPARVLASMIDRFGLTSWANGKFTCISECEEVQMLDIAEDFVYLIINLLSDRDSLMSRKDEPGSQLSTLRKDVAHTLCFKPLSFSDLCTRLTERAQDHEKLQEVLESMTLYRPPEGLHDTGLFELKEEYLQELDPYNSHFTKNQRDEAENIYKAWRAKKLNKPPEDIVLEPKLHPIRSEVYSDLCRVINEPLFANVLHALLTFVASAKEAAPSVSATRIEAFLQVLLHLTLIAVLEDSSSENSIPKQQPSFTVNALSLKLRYESAESTTIVQVLHGIWSMDEYASCKSKIRHILRGFNQKFPGLFATSTTHLHFPAGRFDTASPAQNETDFEAKKKHAMERKARIMAQMQQQQKSFMDKQGVMDWGEEDLSDTETEKPSSTERRIWKYPTGVCIQCREETNDARLYGTFAMVSDAHLLRQTPVEDIDYVREVCEGPLDLDVSIETQRPYGVAGNNIEFVKRLTADGKEATITRRGLSKGWPLGSTHKGPASTSCGHIMHYTCFENYYQSISRRHSHQIARNHPERIALKEFVCPLCKALANVFLPIVWKHTEQSYPGPLVSKTSFDIFTDYALPQALDYNTLLQSTDEQIEKTLHTDTILSFNSAAMLPIVNLLANKRIPNDDLNHPRLNTNDTPEIAGFVELNAAYLRLRESLAIAERTQTPFGQRERKHQSNYMGILLETMANSVAVVEIAYRGRASDYGTSLLSGIPASTLSHLQVLSSSMNAFAASSAVTLGLGFSEQYRHCISGIVKAMFGTESRWQQDEPVYRAIPPLLQADAFSSFTYAAFTICRTEQFPVHHILRLCLTAELMRVAIGLLWHPDSALRKGHFPQTDNSNITAEELNGVSVMLAFIARQLENGNGGSNTTQSSESILRTTACAIRHYARAFLRKAALFLHVAFGVDLPTSAGTEASLSELDRLLQLLQLPRLHVVLDEFSQYSARYSLHNLARNWIKDVIKIPNSGQAVPFLPPIRLLHPAPLELIGLPEHFDVLIEESHRRRCPSTGKELTDPALCLFCGEIFCAQAVCCMSDWKQGGCNVHLEKCSFPVGMFLFIRKCHVVLLHVVEDPKKVEQNQRKHERGESGSSRVSMPISHGSFFAAPYLTKHGETDSGLRSKHQLILNQKRYDKLLRDTWLMVNGSVWSTVARKLEGEVNAGGWETL